MDLDTHLEARLDALTEPADGTAPWRPELYTPADPEQHSALAELLERGAVISVRDTLTEQLAELLTARRPDWRPDSGELASAVADHLGGMRPASYGTWVWYPWSRQLVHVLPPAEYRELRQSRNRYKITAAEQRLLAQKTLAVIGLSVGAASAVTLAQEGVGNRFRLADFDSLSLSNINRLRASVAEIGLPKVVIAARQMYEIDPYLDIAVWPDGLAEENVDAFLAGGGRTDLLVEECDDLYLKIHARERARALGIPVVMETNERGMLDVERFDREPGRPLLHGLLDGVAAADVKAMSTREKVPYVLRILGQDEPSERFVPSLVEIGSTLSSWPQLASGVALGAALVTDTARRLLLGRFTASGRYVVDPDDLIRAGTQVPVNAPVPAPEPVPEATPAALLLPDPGSDTLGEEGIRRLVAHAIRAPSGGNSQPWQFTAYGDALDCRIDAAQPATLLDFERSATHLAIGAAVENIHLAAQASGWACHARVFPDPADPGLVCRLDFSRAAHAPRPALFDWIERRTTNRDPGPDRPLAEAHAAALTDCATENGTRLHLVTDRAQLDEAGRILGAGDRLRMLSPQLHRDMMNELRWSPEEARRTRDGLDVATLGLDDVDLAGVRMARHWSNLAFIRRIGGGAAFEEGARKAVAASSAIGCLTVPGTEPRAYVHGGRALQRLWLTATSHGLGLQPLSSLLYLFARAERGDGAGLDASETDTLRTLRTRFTAVVPRRPDEAELLLFRLSYAAPPAVRSLRRTVEAVLRFDRTRPQGGA
ncbi:Rv1355c family protein [Streptoverticillium reticulum]|uniref:Rv1355c family protein n=1 Tax=Streptoverticillium reticulum TaxID=1433415 RepID=UPI0039BF2D80